MGAKKLKFFHFYENDCFIYYKQDPRRSQLYCKFLIGVPFMVKSELVEILSSKADVVFPQAEELINMLFDSIADALVDDGRVEIRGFGAFTVRKYKSYDGRNPKTGEKIEVPEKKLPFWKTGLELRQRVDGLG